MKIWPHKITLLIGFFIVTLVFFYSIDNFGIFATHDSGIYINTAKYLLTDFQLIDVHNNPLILYPPFYPFLLALGMLSNSTILIQFLILSLNCFLLWQLSGKLFKTSSFRILGFLGALLSLPFLLVHLFYWSEGFYMSLSLGILLLSLKYLDQNSTRNIVVLSILVGFLPLQRLVGISTIAFITPLVFFTSHKNRKIRNTLLCIALSSTGIVLWMLRNYILTGHLFEPYTNNSSGFQYMSVANVMYQIASYFVPHTFQNGLKLLVVVCLTVFFWLGKGRKEYGLLIYYVAVYIIFLLIVDSIKEVGTTNTENLERYLAVIAPITILLFFMAAEKITTSFPINPRYILLTLIIWFSYPSYRLYHNALRWHKYGAGYTCSYWVNSKIIHWLEEEINSDQIVYSDNPMLIASLTRHKSIHYLANDAIHKKRKYIILFEKGEFAAVKNYQLIKFPKAKAFVRINK